jgi:predicted nucleic acid-binding protein
MKLFIDTNIIIDFIMKRASGGISAAILFDYAALGKVDLYASSHSIATTHYVCKKKYSESEIRLILEHFLDIISIISVDEMILRKSIKSVHKDFEDAIQIFCAHKIENIFGIITRNTKDYSTSEIPVYTPDEFLNLIKFSKP